MIQPQLSVKTDVLAASKIVKWNRPHDDSRVWCHRDVQITNVLATSGIVKWNRAQLVRRADLQWVWSGLGLGPAPGLGCGFGRGLGCSWPWRRSWVAPCLLAPASALALATAALGRPGLSVPLSVCLSVCLSACLSAHLSLCVVVLCACLSFYFYTLLSICLSACLPGLHHSGLILGFMSGPMQ